jgi:hypothetical protein
MFLHLKNIAEQKFERFIALTKNRPNLFGAITPRIFAGLEEPSDYMTASREEGHKI